jgi:hypothetical protein
VIRGWICAAPTLEVGKNTVPSFAMDGVKRIPEFLRVVHQATSIPLGIFSFIIARRATASNVSIVAPPIKIVARISTMFLHATLMFVNCAPRHLIRSCYLAYSVF